MNNCNVRMLAVAGLSVAAWLAGAPLNAEPPRAGAASKPADIYDRAADGEKQIAEALAEAQRDHKRVLLQFGANWCKWCHRLHDACKTDKALSRALLYEYVVVLIDVDKVDGRMHNEKVDRKYGNPIRHGLPVLVVLDAQGKQLTTQETGALEEGDHHDPKKVLAFLEKWKATPPSADDALNAALEKARAEKKAVFMDFSAPWCVWCRRLDEYLHRPQIAAVFDEAFVSVKIDVDRMQGGKDMQRKYTGGKQTGIPFYVFLDADGKTLGDSMNEKGNIGYPTEPAEIAHVIRQIRKAAPKLSDDQIATLEKGLREKPAKPAGH